MLVVFKSVKTISIIFLLLMLVEIPSSAQRNVVSATSEVSKTCPEGMVKIEGQYCIDCGDHIDMPQGLLN